MVFQRIISRFHGRSRIRISGQSSNPLSQVRKTRDYFSGISENYQGPTRVLHNAMPRLLGNLGFAQQNSLLGSLNFANSMGPKENERGMDNGPVDTEKNSGFYKDSNQRLDDIHRQPPTGPGRNTGFSESLSRRFAVDKEKKSGFFKGSNQRLDDMYKEPPAEPGRKIAFNESLSRRFGDLDKVRAPNETGHVGRPFARGFSPSESGRNMYSYGGYMNYNENYRSGLEQNPDRSGLEQNPDIVHIKIMRNNTFVTVTDSKGNKKLRGGASSGCLPGGAKASKYSAEATAEHVGRVARSMGLKSVVVKVNGFTFFKKKKLAILAFRDGYTNSRSDKNPIVYIEDTTRKPHNGCRLKKQRRV